MTIVAASIVFTTLISSKMATHAIAPTTRKPDARRMWAGRMDCRGRKGMDRFVHVRIFGGRSYPGSTSCRQGHRPVYPGQPDVWQRTPPETAAAPYLEPSCSACARSPTSAESSRASSAAACDTSFSYEIQPSRSDDLPTHDQLLKQRLADLSVPMGH